MTRLRTKERIWKFDSGQFAVFIPNSCRKVDVPTKKYEIDKAEKAAAQREAREKIIELFADFPVEIDVADRFSKIDLKAKMRENSQIRPSSRERQAHSWLAKYGSPTSLVSNALPSVMLDQLLFKLNWTSVADLLKKNRNRYKSIPIRKLAKFSINEDLRFHERFRQLSQFSVYCEIRALLNIIDMGLATKEDVLFTAGAFPKKIFEDESFFLDFLKFEPSLIQSCTGFMRVRQFAVWKRECAAKVGESLSSEREPADTKTYPSKRALFFLDVFESEARSYFSSRQLLTILQEIGVCRSDLTLGAFKKHVAEASK